MDIYRCGKSGCEIAVNHLKNVCPGSKFTIQILEKLPGNGCRNIPADLVTFNEEILNGKFHFLCNADSQVLEYRLQSEDY